MNRYLAQLNKRNERYAAGLCTQCGKREHNPKFRYCDPCRDKFAKYRADNREYIRKTHRERYHKNRDRNIKTRKKNTEKLKHMTYMAYGGYACACCGEDNPVVLDIDHVNNDGGKCRKDTHPGGPFGLYSWLRKNNYPPNFQILCRNCNWSKYKNGGMCPCKDIERSVAVPRFLYEDEKDCDRIFTLAMYPETVQC